MTAVTAFEIVEKDGVVSIHHTQGRGRNTANVADLLKFLRYDTKQTIRVLWDLDTAVAPILRKLPADILERLSKFDSDLTYEGHELYYLPDRLFRVGMARYYGIRSFWGRPSNKIPTLSQTQALANGLLKALSQCGLTEPRKLTSAIAIFEDSQQGKQLYTGLPRGYDIPEECYPMLEMAGKADRKDWVSNYYVGGFAEGEIFDFDVSGCYPAIASQLPDLRDLDVWQAIKMGVREYGASIGIVQGSFYLNPNAEYAHCSPIIAKTAGDLPGNPLGKIPEDCYAMDEVRFIEDNGLGKFKFKDGWFADPKHGVIPRLPFKDIMAQMYEQRQLSPLANSISKAIANSLIGKLIETKVSGEYGPLRNDIYHALITSRARVQVAEFLIQNQVKADELVCVQTDGCRLTREVSVQDNGMGSWRCNGSEATIVLSPYKVYSADARPYRLTYADVVAMIGEHPLSQTYAKTIEHRLTLVQAIRQHGDATKVGEVRIQPDSLDLITLVTEQNRVYNRLPGTGKGLLSSKYTSEPVVL